MSKSIQSPAQNLREDTKQSDTIDDQDMKYFNQNEEILVAMALTEITGLENQKE